MVFTLCNTLGHRHYWNAGPTYGTPHHMGPYSGHAGGIRRYYPTQKKVT
jgi:hypothetical protein